MKMNPKVKTTPMTKRGGSSASVDVVFLSLAFRPDGTSEEEDAAEKR